MVTVPLEGDVGETPGAALIMSNMLDRRVGMVVRSSGPKRVSKPGSPCVDARARALDHDRLGDARHLQDDRSFDGGACADDDVPLVVGQEPLELDRERIGTGRQRRETHLPLGVGFPGLGSANQRR